MLQMATYYYRYILLYILLLYIIILYRFASILKQDSEVLFTHNLNLNDKLNIVYNDLLVKIII